MSPSNNDGRTLCFKVLSSKVVGLAPGCTWGAGGSDVPCQQSLCAVLTAACRGPTAAAHGRGGANDPAAPLHSCSASFSFVRTAPLSIGRCCGRPPSVPVLYRSLVAPYVDSPCLQCCQQPAPGYYVSRLGCHGTVFAATDTCTLLNCCAGMALAAR